MLRVVLWSGAKGYNHMGKGHRAGHLCTLDTCLFFLISAIAQDKKGYSFNSFYFSTKTYVVDTH